MEDLKSRIAVVLERMSSDLRMRNYSESTIKTYVIHIRRFSRYCGKPAQELGNISCISLKKKGVRGVLTANRRQPTIFFYRTTLDREWMVEYLPYPRRERRLPVVLTQE